MKKIIIAVCTVVLCASCASQGQNYRIKGHADVADGTTVVLKSDEDEKYVIATTVVENGTFEIKGNVPTYTFAVISAGENNRVLVLEKGTINVILGKSSSATGTTDNDILNEFLDKQYAIEDKLDAYREEFAKMEENDPRMNEWKEWDIEYSKQETHLTNSVEQNLDNIVSIYVLRHYSWNFKMEKISEYLSKIPETIKENVLAQSLIERQEAYKRTSVGNKFIDFTIPDIDGNEVSLSDYIGKGKYVLIDFWASWCGPCQYETETLKKAYKEFASKGLEIVGVSLDDNKNDWVKGIKDLGITWPQMSDLKGFDCIGAKLYAVKGIPSIFLIDPDGIIIAKNLRGEEIEKKLSELLN